MKQVLRSAVIFLAVMGTLGEIVPKAKGQAIEELFTPDTPIHREGYKTWSVFLVCNPEWLLPENGRLLADLYQQFKAFGSAIGPDHLAVWFWKRRPRWNTPQLAEDIDVDRSVKYCQAFKLLPSRGPHVLVTAEYPDLTNPPSNYEAIELAGTPPREISSFLSKLADRLLVQGLRTKTPGSDSYWVAWFEAIRGTLTGLGERVRITINTSFFKIEMSGTPGH